MLLAADLSKDTLALRLSGDWSIEQIAQIQQELSGIGASRVVRVRVDSSQLKSLDLSAAWLLKKYLDKWIELGTKVEFAGELPSQLTFIEEISKSEQPQTEAASADRVKPLTAAIAKVGRITVGETKRSRAALAFYGRLLFTAFAAFRRPKHLRITSIARHVYETGIQAIPIVALIAFLITLVIAYIGAQQLKRFGAEIFTVDLVTIGVLREMGVLLTAIIVAGRSGSAFAAEIGVMQLNDEVDALKSIGMDPYEVLVLPRVIGLIIALPLLTILSDAMGLSGGALLCSWLLDIPIPQFISRMQETLAPTTFWAGLIKSPVFAFLIATTGTYRGMQVRDSSKELGRLTTIAVVQAIFFVILANAVFAIVYMKTDF